MAKSRTKLDQLNYRPGGRELDVEIFRFSDLRRRVTAEQILALYHYSFHTLICVTEGAVTQWVDFRPVDCAAGSLLVLRPGSQFRQRSGLGRLDGAVPRRIPST